MKARTLVEYNEAGIEPKDGDMVKCGREGCDITFPYKENQKPHKAFCTRSCKDRMLTKAKLSEARLIDFLSRGRTYPEMERALRFPRAEIEKLLLPKIGEYDLFRTRNQHMEEVFVYLPTFKDEIVVKEREYKFALQADGQPYIWVQFPDEWNFKKLKIIPYSDLHKGAFSHNRELHLEYVNWIRKTPNVLWFINGDFMELAYGDSNRGVSVYEQEVRPRTQREELARELAPIAHKCLWGQPGGHENRSARMDFDPLEWVCERLGIPYFREPIYADILWRGYLWSFFAQHGTTSATTEGGKLNAAMRPLKFQDFTHFTIYSHVHDATSKRVMRMCRDRVNFRLDERKQYIVICPGFLDYLGSYAAKAGMAPGALGNITCEVYPNGDYHATS